MTYSTDLENLFRQAKHGTGRLQAVRFTFQGGAVGYVKDYQDRQLSLTNMGALQSFLAAGFEIDQPQVNEQQKQVLNITFPSAGSEIYRLFKFFAENRTFLSAGATYYEYYIDGNTVNTNPAYILGELNVFSVSVDAQANVHISCSTDNLNTFKVGEIYTYDKFPALRNM